MSEPRADRPYMPGYGVSYEIDFYLANAVFAVRPMTVFGLDDANFTGSPTRWHLDG